MQADISRLSPRDAVPLLHHAVSFSSRRKQLQKQVKARPPDGQAEIVFIFSSFHPTNRPSARPVASKDARPRIPGTVTLVQLYRNSTKFLEITDTIVKI